MYIIYYNYLKFLLQLILLVVDKESSKKTLYIVTISFFITI